MGEFWYLEIIFEGKSHIPKTFPKLQQRIVLDILISKIFIIKSKINPLLSWQFNWWLRLYFIFKKFRITEKVNNVYSFQEWVTLYVT